MKKKQGKLQNAAYILLLTGFREWLELLGYSPLSIPALTLTIDHFLRYQEQNSKTSLEQLEASDANHFIAWMQEQKHCSNGYINKQIQALKLLSKYIRETGRSSTGFNLKRLKENKSKPVWLTKKEIQLLYEQIKDDVLGIRDRAMLAVYYGCGLRLNEGAGLEIKDIIITSKLLHVRKGKHYKERLVPIAQKNLQELRLYIDYGRPQLLQQIKTEALFIDANKGRPMNKQSLYVRIKRLVKKAKIKKEVGTHTLRHSIATHLLQNGMKLERIQQFLGHRNLDSTQLYTHLKNERHELH